MKITIIRYTNGEVVAQGESFGESELRTSKVDIDEDYFLGVDYDAFLDACVRLYQDSADAPLYAVAIGRSGIYILTEHGHTFSPARVQDPRTAAAPA